MSQSTESTEKQEKPQFEALIKAETLQTALTLVNALVDESHLHLSEDGITLPAMDPATVAAVDLSVDTTGFEAIDAHDVHLGINVSQFRDIVQMADREQLIELSLDPETHKFDIKMGELTYTLGLFDADAIRSPLDQSTLDLEFAGEVRLEATDMDRAVQAAEMVSNHLTLGIDATNAMFYVEAEGDTDEILFAMAEDDLVELTPKDVQSLFSVEYLRAINRALPRNGAIDLQFGTEMPLLIRSTFADNAGHVEYLVSPRISSS